MIGKSYHSDASNEHYKQLQQLQVVLYDQCYATVNKMDAAGTVAIEIV